jgi:hypothetical protein
MTTLDDKVKAKVALGDLVELCKEAPGRRWRQPLEFLMGFIKDVPVAPPAPVYTCEGRGGEYELIARAFSAGELKRAMQRSPDTAVDLVIYRDLASGTVYVRDRTDFEERMRRIR